MPRFKPTPNTSELLLHDQQNTPLGWVFWAGVGDYHPTLAKIAHRTLGYFAGVLCIGGRGEYENGTGARGDIVPGDLMIVFPNVSYRYHSTDSGPWGEFWFLFDGPAFLLWRDTGVLSASRPLLRLGEHEFWLNRLLRMVEPMSGTPEDQSLRRVATLQQFLADAVAHARHAAVGPDDHAWLQKAYRLTDPEAGSGGNPDWNEVAHKLGLTYEGFRKRFARLTGTSPAHHRAKRVMSRACGLLMRGMSVGETAARCGFDDPFYFSRQFKKHMGLAPSDYQHKFSGRTE